MAKKLLAVMGIVVILLVAFFVYQSAEKKRLAPENLHEFFWADSNLIDSIAVKFATWTYLYRKDGRWQMVVDSTLTYPAAEADVATMVRATNEMVLTDLISVNPEKRDRFKVDTSQGTIIKFFGNGKQLSHFILGRVGQDFTHTYVQRSGSDSVWLAKGRFASIYSKAPPLWLDRQIFTYTPGEITEIRWRYPDRETRLAPDGKSGFVVSRGPNFEPTPADSAEGAFKYSFISNLTYSAFLPAAREHEASFDQPILKLTVIDSSGKTTELVFAQDTSAANRVFAIRRGDTRPVGIFFKSSYDRLTADYKAMLPRKPDEK